MANILAKQRRANCVVLKLILYSHHKSYTSGMLKTAHECLQYVIQYPFYNVPVIYAHFSGENLTLVISYVF